MIRVVHDTSILISALLSPHGPPAQVFLLTILGPDTQLCVSGNMFAGYEEVIRRPRLNRSNRSAHLCAPLIRRNSVPEKGVELPL
jgi:predicted nucleic acid-binding protein